MTARFADEFPLQQEFFMRAKRLKKSHYHVVDVKVFTEAASNPGSSGFLPNLKTLNLQTFKASELLPVLDDAMHGFQETLEFVDATLKARRSDSELEVYTYTVGRWNLPAIRRIAVTLDVEGTLAYLGGVQPMPIIREARYPGSLHDLERSLQSADVADAASELTLAPIWNLPKLQILTLAHSPAALFNYDSFANMPDLKSDIISNFAIEKVAKRIPQLSTHLYPSPDKIPRGQVDAREMRCRQTALEEHEWTETWSLPKLKSLHFIGYPSMVFSFDWLHK